MNTRIVVAYSGSPAATRALRALAQARGAEVVTLTVDLGQGVDLGQVREVSLAAGAARAHVVDAREEYARDYVLAALRAGVAAGAWPGLVRTLGAPLVAARLAEIAAIEDAEADAAACPWDVEATLLGRIVAGDAYRLTRPPAAAPDAPAFVQIAVDGGIPVAVNDVAMPLTELFESLATIAGQHGVGRVGGVEAPAAVVLQAALRAGDSGRVCLKLFKGACGQAQELVAHP
jgi:argininosuccinate synthase